MTGVIDYLTAHLTQIVIIWQSLFIALSGIAELLGFTAISKVLGTTAALDLGRVIRYVKAFISFYQANKIRRDTLASNVSKIGLVLLVLVVSGCSLEAARQRRINTQLRAGLYSAPAQARPGSECRMHDTIHVYGDWSAGVFGAVGTGAGVLAAAVEDDGVRKAAAVTAGVTAGLAAVAVGVAETSNKTWTEQCSQ